MLGTWKNEKSCGNNNTNLCMCVCRSYIVFLSSLLLWNMSKMGDKMTQHPLDIAFQGIKLLAPNCIKKKKTKNLGSKSLTFLLHPIVSRNTNSGFQNQCFLGAPKLHIRKLIKSGLQNQLFSCISSFSIYVFFLQQWNREDSLRKSWKLLSYCTSFTVVNKRLPGADCNVFAQ
jgi:hypothetical protein